MSVLFARNIHLKMKSLVIITILLISSACFSQSKNYLIANYLFDQGRYSEAKIELEKSLNQKKNSFQLELICFQLGECERILNDSITSSYYLSCIDLAKKSGLHGYSPKQKREGLKRIAFSYYYIGNKKESKDWIEKYLRVNPNDCEAQKLKDLLSKKDKTKANRVYSQ